MTYPKTQEEFDTRQKALADLNAELERLMPVHPTWRYSTHVFSCRICGTLVWDRLTHYKYHQKKDVLDVLVSLFGRRY